MIDTADVNAAAIEGERADACRIYCDRQKIVQRHAGIVQEGRANWLTVADDQNGAISRVVTKLFEMLHDALLKIAHTLPVGGTAIAAATIPSAPNRISGKISKRASSPVADIDLVEGSGDFNREAKMLREDRRRLQGSSLWAGLNVGRCWDDALSATRHLSAAHRVELHARHAATKHAIDPGVVTVANQMNRLHHRYAFASMNARVFSRASSSLNCCGGDFMK